MKPVTETLKTLISSHGIEIIQQPQRLKAMLADLLPNEKRMRYLVDLSLQADIPKKLRAIQHETSSVWDAKINALKHYFKEEYFLEDKPIKLIFDCWVEVLQRIEKNENASNLISSISTVLIPAGTFMMGSPESEVGSGLDDTQHQVTLSSFRMSKYQITNAQYAAFLNVSKFKEYFGRPLNYRLKNLIYLNYDQGLIYSGTQWESVRGYENAPVIDVTWYGATEFASYVGGILPTEAQWEYACRAGTTTPFNTGNFLTNLQANYHWKYPYNGGTNVVNIRPHRTQAVGSYPANAFGLYDMHGNVNEWCVDWYGHYPTSAQTNPIGAVTGSHRVYRGGSWEDAAGYCRSALRNRTSPSDSNDRLGFRVVFNDELTKPAINDELTKSVIHSDSVTDIDGNVYKTVRIGNQVWMAENLKVSRYRNGDLIPNVIENEKWCNLGRGAYCNYDNDPTNNSKYGKLYNWYAVDDKRGLAPKGWHLPSDEEWDVLVDFLGGNDVAGSELKEVGNDSWIKENKVATNKSGFSALPAGYRYDSGRFTNAGSTGFWWSSSEDDGYVWVRSMYYNFSDVARMYDYKVNGFSVRCVKDK